MPSNALPMAPAAFQQWCRARALAPSTCDYLSTIRGSQPVRRVTSRGNSVSGAYPSRKMGVTIQFESQNPELWTIVMMDRDESVLEFFEQPDTFITEQFETPRHPSAATVYCAYEQECRKRGLTALSARAFYQRIKQRATPEQTEAREGARAAYPEQPWFWELTVQTPRQSDVSDHDQRHSNRAERERRQGEPFLQLEQRLPQSRSDQNRRPGAL